MGVKRTQTRTGVESTRMEATSGWGHAVLLTKFK